MSRRTSPSFAVGGVSWLESDGRVSRLNDPTPTGWRCYHCNEHFRDPNAAFRHFGAPATKPGEHPPTACATATDLLAWVPESDDRVKTLLLAEASRRDAADWNCEDAKNVIAFLLATPKPPAGGDAGEWQRAAYASIAANKAATKLIDRMLASLGHLADGLADQKPSWADYARRLFTESQDTAHADRLAALAIPAPVVEGGRVPLRYAADMLDQYAAFIREEVKANDLERHPYVPLIEDVATHLRAALSEGRSHG